MPTSWMPRPLAAPLSLARGKMHSGPHRTAKMPTVPGEDRQCGPTLDMPSLARSSVYVDDGPSVDCAAFDCFLPPSSRIIVSPPDQPFITLSADSFDTENNYDTLSVRNCEQKGHLTTSYYSRIRIEGCVDPSMDLSEHIYTLFQIWSGETLLATRNGPSFGEPITTSTGEQPLLCTLIPMNLGVKRHMRPDIFLVTI